MSQIIVRCPRLTRRATDSCFYRVGSMGDGAWGPPLRWGWVVGRVVGDGPLWPLLAGVIFGVLPLRSEGMGASGV